MPTTPTPRPAPPGHGGWVRRMAPFLRAHRRDVRVAVGAAVVGQVAAGLAPVAQRVVVDRAVVADDAPLGPWLALLVALGVGSFACAYVRRWVGGRVSLAVPHDVRNALFERLQRLDFAGHDRLRTGQLVSRASSDVLLLQNLLAMLPLVLGNMVMLVVAMGVMLVLSPLLTLVLVVALPLLLVLSLRMRTTVFPATWHAQQAAGEVAAVVDEAVGGVRVVKGFGQESRELARLADRARGLYASRVRLVRIQAGFTAALGVVPLLAQAAVLALGGWLAVQERISIGTFLAFSAYLVRLMAPVRMLASTFAAAQQARAASERILDVMDAEPVVVDAPGAVALEVPTGRVELRGVRFGYDPDRPVVDGFDLVVEPGEVVALVGTSGSGKSTVAALVPRYYDVDAGAVLVDGVDVRDVTLSSLRRQVGVVFEEAFLFSDTIRANIAYARPDAGDDEVWAAARAAGAEGFLRELPAGLDTTVGERGLSLSGGQRQRLALARAVLSDPRVLILDDATSAVDARTEAVIHAAMRSVTTGRTTVLVAHRRSTLRLADRIVVVDGGRVVDQGDHQALLARSAVYRRLVAGSDEPDPLDPVVPADPAPVDAPVPAGPAPVGPAGPAPAGGGARPAPPEVTAALERLPPADDDPDVDDAWAAQPRPGRFRLLGHLGAWRGGFTVGVALVAADAVLTLSGPLLVRHGIDHGVRRDDTGALWVAAGAFAGVALLDSLAVRGYLRATGRTAERALYALRVRIFAHLQGLGLDHYDRERDGRTMTRMTTDVEALSQLVTTGLVSALVGGLTCAGVLVALTVLSWELAAVVAVSLAPLAMSTRWYRRRSAEAYTRSRAAIAEVNAELQESLAGVRVTQAHARSDGRIERFAGANRRHLGARLGAQRLIAVYFPFVNLLGDLAAVGVLAVGAAAIDDGRVTAGVLVAFLLYLDQFFAPIQQLSQVLDSWQQAQASVVQVADLLDTPTSTPAAAHPRPPGRLRGEVRLEGVGFAYPTAAPGPDGPGTSGPGTAGSGPPVGPGPDALHDLDLVVAPGETVALVGETGAGKSTIVKLVARFYDPDRGRVLVDGVDVRLYDLPAFRRQLGVVPQEAFLFSGSIRDNIAYGRPAATDAEVEAAARAVGAHAFVAALPGGYGARVSERGRSLSAGQRQLVALARAELVDPAVLLLDEATSNLDLASEARVQRAMGVVASGRTTLLVAHRLPTAAAADRICVVAGGRIVEQGSHRDLLAAEGAYARLWAEFSGSEGGAGPSGGPAGPGRGMLGAW